MTLQNYVFILIFVIAVVLFFLELHWIRNYLRLGRAEDRSGHFWKRIKNVILVGFAQTKILREPVAGLLHALVFWGFVALLTSVLEAFIQGFYSDFSLTILKKVSKVIFASQDFFGGVVVISILVALYRRVFVKPKRLQGDGHSNAEGNIVLLLILCVMFSMFGINALISLNHPEHINYYKFHFIVNQFAPVFSGMSSGTISLYYSVFWWIHIIVVLFFLNFLPYSKHFHIFSSLPNVYLQKIGPQTLDTEEINIEAENPFLGAGDFEQLTWKSIFDGYVCTECGRCTASCPANLTGKPLSPRKIILDTRERTKEKAHFLVTKQPVPEDIEKRKLVSEHYITDDELWACTTCLACVQECPVAIEHVNSIVDMRRYLVQSESRFPEELMTVFGNMENNGAPWAFPQSDRLNWADGIEIPLASDKKEFEVLYWVGCAGAFDARYQKVSRSVAQLLNKAGTNYAVLGTQEKCNGDSARRLGNEFLAQTLIKENVETLKKYKFNKILVSCPHCLQTIGNEYKKFGGDYQVIHHTEFISDLIKDSKIEIDENKKLNDKITYHDSCYLGRYNDIYDEPRDILKMVNNGSMVEMERNKDRGLCCGAGGGRMWLEEKIGKKVNIERTEEALSVNPDIVSTACPFCMTMMTDGIKEKDRTEDVQVKDFAEIVFETLK